MATSQTPGQDGLLATSDYSLNKLIIITSTGITVDVSAQMVELDLYEDIFSPCMTGSLKLADALDLISTMSFHGNEFLIVEIDKPSLNQPIKKTFRIIKCSDRSFGTSSLQNYTLHFCSEEFFLSTQIFLSKSYKGLRIDQIINDILLNRLQTPASKINVMEQTAGNFDIIIPRMQPFEAINWLCTRAYNTNKNLFFFFENRDGYNFVSYESLISLPAYNTYSRSLKLDQDPVKNIASFNYIYIVEDFNLIKAMSYGAFSSTLLTLDIINRKFNAYNFNMKGLQPSSILNSNLPVNDFTNRLGYSLFTTPQNMVKFAITTDADPSGNPTNIKGWLPQTAARLGQINLFKLITTVPGDILIKAGMVVNIVIQKMQPQSQATVNDPIRSGKYLISSCHHKFVADISTTIIELLSDSISSPIPNAATGSPTLQQVINT